MFFVQENLRNVAEMNNLRLLCSGEAQVLTLI